MQGIVCGDISKLRSFIKYNENGNTFIYNYSKEYSIEGCISRVGDASAKFRLDCSNGEIDFDDQVFILVSVDDKAFKYACNLIAGGYSIVVFSELSEDETRQRMEKVNLSQGVIERIPFI